MLVSRMCSSCDQRPWCENHFRHQTTTMCLPAPIMGEAIPLLGTLKYVNQKEEAYAAVKQRSKQLHLRWQLMLTLVIEAFDDDNGDELWLGMAIQYPGKDKGVSKVQHTGDNHIMKNKTRYDPGDYMMAVQFYERSAACDEERREFEMGERRVDLVNGAELRGSKFKMALLNSSRSRRSSRPEEE